MNKITANSIITALKQTRIPKPNDSIKRKAAVLVPIIAYTSGLTVLFTQRAELITEHAGQISFPGGRYETSDQTLEKTSIRETEEEIGLPAQQIQIIRQLPSYETVSGKGFIVTPFVALISPPITLIIDAREVATTFEVPLEFLVDKTNYKRKHRMWQGKRRYFYVIEYEGHIIWGLTARILVSLAKAISQSM